MPQRRQIIVIATTWVTAAVVASAAPGYLAVVGPVQFRFEARPAPQTHVGPAPVTVVAEVPPAPVPTGATNAAAGSTNQVASPAPMDVDSEGGIPGSPGAVISPQMLLQYFSRSTNGTGTGVIAPMMLPPPGPPPSSSATYTH